MLVLGAVVTGLLTAGTQGKVPSTTVIAGYLLIVGASTALGLAALRARHAAVGPRGLAAAPARMQVD
jgi:hypothetical protein